MYLQSQRNVEIKKHKYILDKLIKMDFVCIF